MVKLSRDCLYAIAHAYGLGHEIFNSSRRQPDPFMPVLQEVECLNGYLCRVEGDKARELGSTIASHDESGTIIEEGWQLRITDVGKYERELSLPPAERSPKMFYKPFTVDQATFVATETEGYIPERIFLYVAQPHFDANYVIKRLTQYRNLHPRAVYGLNSKKLAKRI